MRTTTVVYRVLEHILNPSRNALPSPSFARPEMSINLLETRSRRVIPEKHNLFHLGRFILEDMIVPSDLVQLNKGIAPPFLGRDTQRRQGSLELTHFVLRKSLQFGSGNHFFQGIDAATYARHQMQQIITSSDDPFNFVEGGVQFLARLDDSSGCDDEGFPEAVLGSTARSSSGLGLGAWAWCGSGYSGPLFASIAHVAVESLDDAEDVFASRLIQSEDGVLLFAVGASLLLLIVGGDEYVCRGPPAGEAQFEEDELFKEVYAVSSALAGGLQEPEAIDCA